MGDLADHPIILFDGVCILCHSIVAFVIRHDRAPGQFKFAPLQSPKGQRLLCAHGMATDDLNTLVLVEADRASVRSTAALRMLRRLGFPFSLLYGFIIVPAPLRDVIYRCVARSRYRLFGRYEQCMVPSDEIRSRFLE